MCICSINVGFNVVKDFVLRMRYVLNEFKEALVSLLHESSSNIAYQFAKQSFDLFNFLFPVK